MKYINRHNKFFIASALLVLSAFGSIVFITTPTHALRLEGPVAALNATTPPLARTLTCSATRWNGDIKLTVTGFRTTSTESTLVIAPLHQTTSSYQAYAAYGGVYRGNNGVYAGWHTWHKGYVGNGQIGWVYDGIKTASCLYPLYV